MVLVLNKLNTLPELSVKVTSRLHPEKIIETISNLKTGEVYANDQEWKEKGVKEEDIRRDVKVIMPSLDLFGKTK